MFGAVSHPSSGGGGGGRSADGAKKAGRGCEEQHQQGAHRPKREEKRERSTLYSLSSSPSFSSFFSFIYIPRVRKRERERGASLPESAEFPAYARAPALSLRLSLFRSQCNPLAGIVVTSTRVSKYNNNKPPPTEKGGKKIKIKSCVTSDIFGGNKKVNWHLSRSRRIQATQRWIRRNKNKIRTTTTTTSLSSF